MQLLSSRWQPVWIAAVLTFTVFSPMIAFQRSDGMPPALLNLLSVIVLAGIPTLVYFLFPQRVIAEVEGPMVRIGRKWAPVADLMGVQVHTIRVNLIPASRTLIFSFRVRASDGLIARATGAKRIGLAVGGIAGGRKAGETFGAKLIALAANAQRTAMPAPGAEPARDAPRDDGFDPDAIIARYMATRDTDEPPPAPPAPSRTGFGRKGL